MKQFTDIVAFDSYALTFDEAVNANPAVAAQRERIYALIERLLPPGGRILDINCGTGTDAIALAQRGYSTLGIDISSEMIERARRKAKETANVRFEIVPFAELPSLERNAFDLVLSNNSGLNCTSDLAGVLQDVWHRLCVGGYFIAVVMTPFSWWEFAAGVLRLDWRYARRRKQQRAHLGGYEIPVFYYSESAVRATARQLFEVVAIEAFNVVSPPPNATTFTERLPQLSRRLAAIDRALCRLPILRRWGDQILVVMKKGA